MNVPVLARVIRLSIVRYCSVITTIAGVAAIEATVELVGADGIHQRAGSSIELAIPAVPPAALASLDAAELGVAEPVADEADAPDDSIQTPTSLI